VPEVSLDGWPCVVGVVPHDIPAARAFNGLVTRLNGNHYALRCTDLAVREPRPTKLGLAPKLITDSLLTAHSLPVLARNISFHAGTTLSALITLSRTSGSNPRYAA